MEKERESQGRILESVQIGEYTLLNNEKLGRALDLLEGITEPTTDEDARVVAACKKLGKEKGILALYDRFGGGVRLDKRKIALGTFFDFAAREPRKNVVISEDTFEDEQVLVRKRTRKTKTNESAKDRMRRLNSKQDDAEDEDEEPVAGDVDDVAPPKGTGKAPKAKKARK